jgi:FlaA1/EpsC-like NDP-sugar epimerase
MRQNLKSRMAAVFGSPWTIRYLRWPISRYLVPSLADCMLVVLAYYAALSVRFVGEVPMRFLVGLTPWVPLVALVYVGANFRWQIYGRWWRRATARDAMALVEATGFATLMIAGLDLLQGSDRPLPISLVLLGGLLAFVLMFVVRSRHFFLSNGLSGRYFSPRPKSDRAQVLIVGAGDHGQRLARHLRDDPTQQSHYEVVGFIDDDETKVRLRIDGLAVLGTRHSIPDVVRQHAVDQIIITGRAAFGDSFDEVVTICQETAAQIKVLPRLSHLLGDLSQLSDLRDLTIEDLLEREPVRIDRHTCLETLTDQTILVTGAGGSIGSELCRQLLHFNPRYLLLVDNNETGLYDLHRELRDEQSGQATSLVPLVADVTNYHKMRNIFRYYTPQIVYHAAAYKHVPVMESHPDEAVRINVIGTLMVSDLADDFGAERFIFISTDKAVNPTCVMGASKRIAELWIAALQQGSRTRFVSVRFGNVLGSRGSVIPLFNRQIERGGPVTVTDPRMTRYFMSIPEAASLIIQAGVFAKGGETYMLDMGQPVHIVDLASKMIRLKGLRPGRDIQIKFIGIRPGEKLHEQLAYETESKHLTAHPKIYSLEDHVVSEKESLLQLIAVFSVASQSNREMIARLGKAVILAAHGNVDSSLEALTDMPLLFGERGWAVEEQASPGPARLDGPSYRESRPRPVPHAALEGAN